MEILIFLPLVGFYLYLGTLRVLIYWRMVKHKTFFDYIIIFLHYQLAVVPLTYLQSIPEPVVLSRVRRYDSLVKYYYLTMLITGLSMVVAYRIMRS